MNINRWRGVVGLTSMLLIAPQARADVVLDWNATALATIAGAPFPTARFMAITQLAVFEAVNAIGGDYEPYLGTIVAPGTASREAAAASAAHAVLRAYFPARAAALDAALVLSLSAIPDGQAKLDGIAVGQASAAAMIALRNGDGSELSQNYLPTTDEPGQWLLTGNCPPVGGGFMRWGNVAPFGILTADQFRPGPPPSLHSGKYRQDYLEVKTLGDVNSGVRTPDRTDVARFFAALSPVALANSAARQVATAQGRTLSENARALALLNMAISDAAVATFDTKYHYTFWRPETAIHAAGEDGNDKTDPDTAFVPLINAPCFPSYPSAHGTLSGAAAEMLERLYGPSGHDITLTTAAFPALTFSYTDFKSIVSDVSDARVNGGIHFRFDQEAGEALGRTIAHYVIKNRLRVVHP